MDSKKVREGGEMAKEENSERKRDGVIGKREGGRGGGDSGG